MEALPAQFAHVLLFECPNCGRPLATACNATNSNLEAADGHYFQPHCHCGWTGTAVGLEAIKHWVEPWTEKAPIGDPNDPTSCDSPV
jgi:hypothetical protein